MADIIDNVQAVIDVTRAGVATKLVAETLGKRHLFIPGHGYHASRIEAIDMEKGAPAPLRKRGTVTVFDAASFNQVIKDNTDEGSGDVSIYFDRTPEKPAVIAVLNGNGKGGPGWGDFRVQIEFRPTPQWVKWKAWDGKMISQLAFAEFIEDNIEDIVEPAGATMLEVATYLQVARTVDFKSGLRLSNGTVQFRHEQTDLVKANTVEVPETFTLGIAPIFGLASYRVPARFRYRLIEGKLQLGYKLQRIETMMATIVEDVIARIERGANISVMDGLPPS